MDIPKKILGDKKVIKVGITEFHGIAKEYSRTPPEGVEYSEVQTDTRLSKFVFSSAAKGVYAKVSNTGHDLIEAPLFPVITKMPWIYTPAAFSSAGAFDFFGIPTPRSIKMVWAQHLLAKDNLKQIVFKSKLGLETLREYGGNSVYEALKDKSSVVYPAIRRVDDSLIRYKKTPRNLLFVGEFVRKGGLNVVDAYIRLKSDFPELKLTICSNPNFETWDDKLTQKYKKIISDDPNIEMGLVDREELLNDIIPISDIYLCPTYQEAWGFSIQEAMAYGIPSIVSNVSAIPEMINHGENGLLIDIKNTSYIKSSKGYVIDRPDEQFMEETTTKVYYELVKLLQNPRDIERIGLNAVKTSREKFSIETRNEKISKIYKSALFQ